MTSMKVQPGVLTGSRMREVFEFCKANQCALPAVNVVTSNSVNAALQAARESRCPIIVQLSSGGAHFFAGKSLDNSSHQAAIAGAVACATYVHQIAKQYGVPVILHTDHASRKLIPWVDGMIEAGENHFERHGHPLFSSHMLDLSEETLDDNIETCRTTLERMAKIDMCLEIELGVTGGEEDGVDNSHVDNAKLYTQPDEVLRSYEVLQPVGMFTVAASFGNTHGVYKPGNVVLRPEILKNSQEKIAKKHNTAPKPVHFVFHGGSGSSPADIKQAVSYGVVKMNIDTDTQWAFAHPVKQYMDRKSAYLQSQIGNPDGDDAPNKKYIDPRAWLHAAEKGMAARLVQAARDLNAFGKFEF